MSKLRKEKPYAGEAPVVRMHSKQEAMLPEGVVLPFQMESSVLRLARACVALRGMFFYFAQTRTLATEGTQL
jgi:hypothetical protein